MEECNVILQVQGEMPDQWIGFPTYSATAPSDLRVSHFFAGWPVHCYVEGMSVIEKEEKMDVEIDLLDNLLQKAIDARSGYETAAKSVDNKMLRSLFRENSAQRNWFATEIGKLIDELGGDSDGIDSSTSAESKAHRLWIGLKAWSTDGDERSVLEECERGERSSIDEYDDVISTLEQGGRVRRVIERQRDRVKEELVTITYLWKPMGRTD
ncbi:MAG: hypothetical protein ACI9R3_004366 [Verrucomicrobiales bacterium]|jgi:uncharacterized protein (TIGR02284 family)